MYNDILGKVCIQHGTQVIVVGLAFKFSHVQIAPPKEWVEIKECESRVCKVDEEKTGGK